MCNCTWRSAWKALCCAHQERLNGTARQILAVVERVVVCNKETFHNFRHWGEKKLKTKFFLQLLT